VIWDVSHKADINGCRLADGHYSRRSVGAPQFMPPGQTLVLICDGAVFGWWRPHPKSGLKSMNGLDGWTCSIFRNVSSIQSSALILEAESILANKHECGPHGMLTYVWDSKVRSANPGYCFKCAGWHIAGRCIECASVRPRSADKRKTLLHKSFSLAGQLPESV